MTLALLSALGATPSFAKKNAPYVAEEKGRATWRTTFDKRMHTPEEQWDYANKLRENGRLKKADRLMLYLVNRWPNSKEAPAAQRARADMFYERGENKKAFEAYQYLIDNYSSRMKDYNSVLEAQFKIAVEFMEKRRMRWLFGGYKSPEYAVDYFEQIIRNGPQWEKATKAQFLIGQAYQRADELENAIAAYGVLLYRYPESPLAEDAAWQRILSLDELRKEYPNNLDILDKIVLATTVFLSTYPETERRDEVIQLRNSLYEVKAQKAFDIGVFYEKVPKNSKAALLSYQKMIEEYPKSRLVPDAQERIAELEKKINPPEDSSEPKEKEKTDEEAR
jgi:outer membrane protein assembly factor BamD (BamD/ComL family)